MEYLSCLALNGVHLHEVRGITTSPTTEESNHIIHQLHHTALHYHTCTHTHMHSIATSYYSYIAIITVTNYVTTEPSHKDLLNGLVEPLLTVSGQCVACHSSAQEESDLLL